LKACADGLQIRGPFVESWFCSGFGVDVGFIFRSVCEAIDTLVDQTGVRVGTDHFGFMK
jgi:hypothetical protein